MTGAGSAAGDRFDLHRFVEAQERVYPDVLTELRAGRKTSHWIWYVFPQAEGLGGSFNSRRYAIGSRGEARAYLDHPVLGGRLVECVELVLAHADRPIASILAPPDDLKFRSCLTLFDAVATDEPVFLRGLDAFFAGRLDQLTVAIVERWTA